jgi:hypothetical protein
MVVDLQVAHYYVDEADDFTLFNKRGVVVVGRPGVSRCVMVGVAFLPDPGEAHGQLGQLRASLLSDPYFRGVPSMQPEAGKTAICFHAKDDVPEVRREVFKLLPKLGAKVQVVVRRKAVLAAEAHAVMKSTRKRLDENAIYDSLVRRLFKNLLHKAPDNRITFARRGKADRQEALHDAIRRAKANFEKQWGIASVRPTTISSTTPSQSAGLQVVDYYLWAIQRLFERAEDRYVQLLASQYRLVMDLDDARNKPYGEWYSDSNPLTLEKMKPVAG